MFRNPLAQVGLWILLAVSFLEPAVARADEFPEITAAERAFTQFADEPKASTVSLFRRAEFWMMGTVNQLQSSRLVVHERRKILSQSGLDQSDVRVVHNAHVRLSKFKGRTVLPDGRVVPLPADAKFTDTASRSQRLFVTSVAFPAVEPGAILDYSYEMNWDSIFFLDPFYFQQDVPVLSAEIVYHIPNRVQSTVWRWDPVGFGIQTESTPEREGTTLRAWAANLPSVPNEPSGPPFGDLAMQSMVIPVAYRTGSVHQPLMGDWGAVCELFHTQYEFAQKREGNTPARARDLVKTATTPRERAEILYRFVRDEIETERGLGIGLREGVTVGETLGQGRGDAADKAVLLQVMLSAVKLDSRLVWAANREGGRVDATIPNPAWFDRPLVAIELEKERVYLDPADRALAFGRLPPGFEGTTAILFDRKKPQVIQLPSSPAADNTRVARLDLAVDDEGGVRGKGSLKLRGAHAWTRTDWREGEVETLKAWTLWLEGHFPDYVISDVVARETIDPEAAAPDADTPRVDVDWSMALRDEKTLPDEVTLVPSQPLGPSRASALFPPAGRRTPLFLAFADRDDVELHLTWPENWKVESAPRPVSLDNVAGGVTTSIEVDAAARSALLKRRVDVKEAVVATREQVAALKQALVAVEKSDAQTLLLIRQ